MILRRRLALRSRNHLDQNYKLSPHRLIFDGGVGAQQWEAENAVDDEQAVDVWFLAVTIVEKRYVDAEHLSDLLEPRRADPVDALFVFLHLLKGEPEVTGQLFLRDACFPATPTDSPPHLDVRVPGRSWAGLGRTRPRFGLPAHGKIILQPKGDGKGGLGDYLFYLCAGIIDLAQGPDQSEGDHSSLCGSFRMLDTRKYVGTTSATAG